MADRLARRDARWYMWLPALAAITAVPFMMVQYFTGNFRLSLLVGFVPATLLSSFLAPLVATAQSLVPANLRAFTSAVLVLVVNIVGLGMGPLITGIISDVLVSDYGLGRDSLRYAIAASAVGAVWAAVHFMRSAFFLRNELAAAAASSLPASRRESSTDA